MSAIDLSVSSGRGILGHGPAERRVLFGCMAIAALLALLLGVVVPRGGDAAAHLYRTFLVQRGVLLWDNLWFAGQYPLVSYSLLYYLPAAVFGNELLAAVGVVASAALFASLVLRRWGLVGRWPAYWFAVVAGGQFFTGDYPYTVGFTALLATLWALQNDRIWLGVAFAALTLGASPLAFLFLCLSFLALFLWYSRPRRRALTIAAAVVVLAGVEFGALQLFPSHGLYYPFGVWRLALGVPVGLLGFAIALRSRAGRPLASIFLVWTLATIASFFISSPVGHNLLRPATIVFPLMLLAALLADFKPRWLTLTAVVAAFAANVGPYVTTMVERADNATKAASFWAPMLTYVARHSSHDFRLEVVPTVNHWEAFLVPKAGYPIARGWYEQLDTGDNPILYRRPLTARVYRAWLRSVGVRYVIAAHTTPAAGSSAEEDLLTSGMSGLVRVFSGRNGSVYELRDATPLLTGPGGSAITFQSHASIKGWVSRAGTYVLRVHYTPFWTLTAGSLCLQRGPNGMTQIRTQRPGPFSLRAPEGPDALLTIVFDEDRGPTIQCAREPAGVQAPR